jgi:hypothetical protein
MSSGSANQNTVGNCNLLGGEGILLQGTLIFLSFCILIVKRHIEKPKRSWKIWFMDVSKQGFSALTAHSLNVALAIWLSDSDSQTGSTTDPCIWYFVTIVLDTTLGIFLSISFLVGLEKIFTSCGYTRLKSGNYFKISHNDDIMSSSYKSKKIVIDCTAWILQLIVWIFIVIASKTILGFLQKTFEKPLTYIAEIFFAGLDLTFPFIKLIVVLVIVPILGNAIQIWISDNFLKKKDFSKDDDAALQGNFLDAKTNKTDLSLSNAETWKSFNGQTA